MKLRILLISLSLALFAWQNASAQLAPAEDFFNGGAQLYISNNIPAALERVETGLKIYPEDDKLKKLEQLLKQQQQQQNQSQQQQAIAAAIPATSKRISKTSRTSHSQSQKNSARPAEAGRAKAKSVRREKR